ncbi:MAG: hypothetical protein Q8Q08_05535 [Candidatus Omnitrophota bacterium]|nr:hypothetical protein [Candidatus Omnitrophota bacterium]MDZ4242508.1 hypothetical protein [Candidatus Omnitrophota bacterium]
MNNILLPLVIFMIAKLLREIISWPFQNVIDASLGGWAGWGFLIPHLAYGLGLYCAAAAIWSMSRKDKEIVPIWIVFLGLIFWPLGFLAAALTVKFFHFIGMAYYDLCGHAFSILGIICAVQLKRGLPPPRPRAYWATAGFIFFLLPLSFFAERHLISGFPANGSIVARHSWALKRYGADYEDAVRCVLQNEGVQRSAGQGLKAALAEDPVYARVCSLNGCVTTFVLDVQGHDRRFACTVEEVDGEGGVVKDARCGLGGESMTERSDPTRDLWMICL